MRGMHLRIRPVSWCYLLPPSPGILKHNKYIDQLCRHRLLDPHDAKYRKRKSRIIYAEVIFDFPRICLPKANLHQLNYSLRLVCLVSRFFHT